MRVIHRAATAGQRIASSLCSSAGNDAGKPHSVWKSPGCGGASGVNSQRSGLRSISGVSSRQSRPRTSMTLPSTPRKHGRAADRIGADGRAQSERTAGRLVFFGLCSTSRGATRAASRRPPGSHRNHALDRGHPGLEISSRQRAVQRPRRGGSSRVSQGVRMRPTNTRPASLAGGTSTVSSPSRISVFGNHFPIQ